MSLRRPGALALVLGLLLGVLLLAGVHFGTSDRVDLRTALQGVAAMFGLAEPLPPMLQAIAELRVWRALTAAGVGAALGLSGALIQGLFRNGLASPGVIGIGSGASLGAVVAVVMAGGYGTQMNVAELRGAGTWLVPLAAFIGATATAFLVYRLSASHGRVSIPALLLIGIAMNALLSGVQQLVQSLVLENFGASRAILAWTFGTLDDRTMWHAAIVWGGVLLGLAAWPFVAWELDLMQAGLEDAAALGVDVARVRTLSLVAASLSAAAAVSVAGQIGFVGLIVPHLTRLAAGRGHKTLLPLSALMGAAVLLAADVTQMALVPEKGIQPGVVMSLVGGPFFVWLLWTKRRELAVW